MLHFFHLRFSYRDNLIILIMQFSHFLTKIFLSVNTRRRWLSNLLSFGTIIDLNCVFWIGFCYQNICNENPDEFGIFFRIFLILSYPLIIQNFGTMISQRNKIVQIGRISQGLFINDEIFLNFLGNYEKYGKIRDIRGGLKNLIKIVWHLLWKIPLIQSNCVSIENYCVTNSNFNIQQIYFYLNFM